MKVFKSTLGIDMSITTFIISTLCQNRKGEDTGYDHQHLKDNLQKHDDNSPGCYQKYKESQRWQSGKSPKDDGEKSNTFMRTHATFCGFRQKQIKTFCGFRQNKVKTFCGFRQKLYLCTHNQLIIRQIYIPLWTNSQKSILRELPTNI